MKKKVLAIMVAAMTALSMAGCGSSGNTASSSAAVTASTAEANSTAEAAATSGDGKTFVYGTTGYGVDMGDAGTNPHDSYTGWSTLRYGIGETLFKFSDSMEPEPWLATDYKFTDDTHCVINLRDDVTFSSGRKMDGEAVKECLEDLISVNDRAPGDLKIKSITADGQSITIETTEPTPALINYLCDPYGCIVDMQAGEKDRIVAGTGPFVATHVTDTEIDLDKNPNYWGDDVKVDHVIVKGINDGDTLTAALQTGEIDATYGLPYASYSLFENNDQYGISYCETSRQFFGKFNMNTPALQDANVRKAICEGIDKDSFVKVLLDGHGATSVGPFPANFTFGDDTVTGPSYDPEDAKKLLADAGWTDTDGDGYVDKDGQKLSLRWLTYPGRQELPLLAESAQATLKDIGIDIRSIRRTTTRKSGRMATSMSMSAPWSRLRQVIRSISSQLTAWILPPRTSRIITTIS